MQRRTLLRWGVAGGAVLVVAGGGAALMHTPAWREGVLQASGRSVLGAVARAVLDGSLPDDAAAQRAAIDAHLSRAQGAIAAMSPATQREIGLLLSLLASMPGRWALAGLREDWQTASTDSLQSSLRSMRASGLLVKRQAYHALRDLTHAAYFADRGTWALLHYPGPRELGAVLT